MVNHFASLLVNLDLLRYNAVFESYKLADNIDNKIVDNTGTAIASSEMFATADSYLAYSPLICRNYHKLELPHELTTIYNILFPEDASSYYKQFLLYCYLRLIASTDKQDDVKNYDNRISYDLEDFSEYFKSPQTQITSASNAFKLLLHGALQANNGMQSNINNFVVQQVGNTYDVSIFSKTEGKYYKQGQVATASSAGMLNMLSVPSGNNVSSTVVIGDTGLSFNMTGPFAQEFTATANKSWTFTATTSMRFDVVSTIAELKNNYTAVENMLNFTKASCNISYENMWHMHYNDVYRLVGLLLSYVERVNLVWQQKAM